MNIVRIWIYKKTVEDLKHPDCKQSATNKVVVKNVRGDFEYYDISDSVPRKTNRKEAHKWALETGNKIDTLRGYPKFMIDMGYRA